MPTNNCRCVVLLQNAWSGAYAGGVWPRRSWLPALHGSLTGRRLGVVFPGHPADVWYDNTTPIVSEEPSGVEPPDLDHVRRVLAEKSPRFVLACGKQAEGVAVSLWPGRLIVMPHPAYRFISNDFLESVRLTIEADQFTRTTLRVQKPDTATAIEHSPPRRNP